MVSTRSLGAGNSSIGCVRLSFTRSVSGGPFTSGCRTRILEDDNAPSSPCRILHGGGNKCAPTRSRCLFLGGLGSRKRLSCGCLHLSASCCRDANTSFGLCGRLAASTTVVRGSTTNGLIAPIGNCGIVSALNCGLPSSTFHFGFAGSLLASSLRIRSFSRFIRLTGTITPGDRGKDRIAC